MAVVKTYPELIAAIAAGTGGAAPASVTTETLQDLAASTHPGGPAAFNKAGTQNPTPGTRRLVGFPNPPSVVDAATFLLTQPLCATATVTSQVKTTNQADFSINGQVFRKAATDNFWTLTGSALAISSWRKYLLMVDTTGAATVLSSQDSTASAAATIMSPPPTGKAIFGVLTIATDGATTFTPGTTLLGAAGITATFVDGLDPLMVTNVPPTTAPSIVVGANGAGSAIAGSRLISGSISASVVDPNVPWKWFGPPLASTSSRVTATAVQGAIQTGSIYGLEFEIDCTSFEFKAQGNANSGYRMQVNGQYINPTALNVGTGTFNFLVTFNSRAVRQIRLEFSGGVLFYGLNLAAADTVWIASASTGPKVIFYGDSLVAGVGATFQGGLTNYVTTCANYLGWRDFNGSGLGGTGFLASTTYRTRVITDLISLAPDIVVIQGSTNDSASSGAQIQAEATLLFAQIRAALPNVKLIAWGPWTASGTPTATVVAQRDGIQAALALDSGPHLFVDNIVATASGANTLGWITGTGKVGTTTGSGNGDIYISSDGTHPSQAGHDYVGRRLASAIAAAMPF